MESQGRRQLQLNLDVGKGPEPDDSAQFPSELHDSINRCELNYVTNMDKRKEYTSTQGGGKVGGWELIGDHKAGMKI